MQIQRLTARPVTLILRVTQGSTNQNAVARIHQIVRNHNRHTAGVDRHLAQVEQGMKVRTEQEAVGGMVSELSPERHDAGRFERVDGIEIGDRAAVVVGLQECLAETGVAPSLDDCVDDGLPAILAVLGSTC